MIEKIIDSHQHFWDPYQFDYFWLKPDDKILYRQYLPEHLKPEMDRAGVESCVFVQANHQLAENDWVLDLIDRTPWLAGMVGWVDLTRPKVAEVLDGLIRFVGFKGVRHLIQREPDDRWLLRPDVQAGLDALADRRLTFDLSAHPRHLRHLPEVVGRHPTLTFVVDHMAGPPLASGDLDTWAQDMAALALFPNVYCKVSGLVTKATPGAWTPDDLKPAIQIGVELFGFDRLMFGSDWPVCLRASTYQKVVSATKEALGDIDTEASANFWRKNAMRVYHLDERNRG